MNDIKRVSLGDIRGMKARGALHHVADAPAGEDLGPEFWANARLQPARSPRSVHLKVDAEVFEFFKGQGRGHLTRMQDVLKAYVRAHTRS